MRVENVAEHPALIDVIGRWHWDEWGHADPTGSVASWTDGLRRRAGRGHVPMTFVAINDAGAPIGSVSLVEHDMPDRPEFAHLTPWVAGTYVVAEKRGQGVGSALMRHVTDEAHRLGLPELFLYTSAARVFYERLGWVGFRDDFYEGEQVTLMTTRVRRTPPVPFKRDPPAGVA